MARKNVSKRVRFEVMRRDGFQCRYCGTKVPDTGQGLTIDHVVPVALGGSDDPSNLVTACRDCNAGKTSTSPDSGTVGQVSADALRWAEAMKVAAAELAADQAATDAKVDAFDQEWERWRSAGEPVDRPHDWRRSIEQFIQTGLPESELARLVEVAMAARVRPSATWAYFCGCCWKVIREMQDRASEIVGRGQPSAVGAGAYGADYPTLLEAGVALRQAGLLDEVTVAAAVKYMAAHIGEEMAAGLHDGWTYQNRREP